MPGDPGSSDQPDERPRAEPDEWGDDPFAAEDRTDRPRHEAAAPPDGAAAPDAAAPHDVPHHPYARIGSAGGGPYPVRERPEAAEKRRPGPEEQEEG